MPVAGPRPIAAPHRNAMPSPASPTTRGERGIVSWAREVATAASAGGEPRQPVRLALGGSAVRVVGARAARSLADDDEARRRLAGALEEVARLLEVHAVRVAGT